MAAKLPAKTEGVALERSYGPKMRKLIPRHRVFVVEYVRLKNATEAARRAGYTSTDASSSSTGRGKGAGLRVTASRLLDRDDIADAIVEETLRRLKADMHVNMGLVQEIATGACGNENHPLSHATRLKALEIMLDRAAPPTMKIEQDVKVEITVRDRWEKLCRMAVARGDDPESILRNLPETDRIAIRTALEHKEAATIDTEFEEVV